METVQIVRMRAGDVDAVYEAFTSWKKARKQFENYFAENLDGSRTTLLAYLDGKVVGYGNLLKKSYYPPFVQDGIPEINDLNVVTNMQGRGIGTRSISELILLAKGMGYGRIGLGVVLSPDYAKAQRLYPHLGFGLDGRGISKSNEGDELHFTRNI